MRRAALAGLVALAACGALVLGSRISASPYPEVDAIAGLVPGESLSVRSTVPGGDGTTTIRFDRHLDGLRVLGEHVIVQVSDDGALLSVNALPEITLESVTSTSPGISASEAKRRVAQDPGTANPRRMRTELLVYAMQPPARLAWEVTSSSETGEFGTSDTSTVVDAQTGEIIAVTPLGDIH